MEPENHGAYTIFGDAILQQVENPAARAICREQNHYARQNIC